ncbi:hypothetical protein [Anaeromassilibacillus senegalensis]|uniref:hypothetical protein n=1 Tax=Anaeromassilibacillus senegalensis TaxID=1673717 RepID=UPI00068128C3|nr:hypothetical protein [Anaeromassilibacillus senegalensis]
MTRTILLECLRDETMEAVHDIIMPVSMQKGDVDQAYRPADTYLARLPDSSAAKKKVPYILHQIITGKDAQTSGQKVLSTATVRTIFCVYNNDEQEGGLTLLNLMERLRIQLLRKVVIGNQFTLDLEAGLEVLVYPEDTAPYYAGEMISVWKLPAVEREVRQWL